MIVLGDFAENYQFILQDEIQGFQWNSSQCTLHPIVVYYKVNNSIQSHSPCFVSNDLTHDVDMIYEVIKHTIDFAKIFIPLDINKVHYFSGGCGGQYKNCKTMLNQTYHFKNFGIKATWSYFATSHGKSPCNGIGDTIKRLTATESLQWVYQDQILTADSWGYDRVLSRKCLWNNYNLYLYSSGSAAKRFNERKITTGQNNPRNTKLSLFWGSPRPQDCHEKNFILM